MITQFETIDDYIAAFPEHVQVLLQQMRATIRAAAPEAKEAIKYGMPTFVLHGNLVYFAGFKNHIGFYATPNGNEAFASQLADYKQGKGSIQFPLSKPLPLDLVTKMTQFRKAENEQKAAIKRSL
jgi:uncharacterized protein YdhG (YjbR/CyaY superfamily)